MTHFVQCIPITDEDLATFSLPAEGPALWKILKVKEGLSKAQQPKVEITYKVKDSKGNICKFTEHLPMDVGWRVGRLSSVTGTSKMAKEGRLDIDIWVNKTGEGVIKHEKSTGYDDKAVWASMSKPSENSAPVVEESFETQVHNHIGGSLKKALNISEEDEDIPF